VKYDELVGTVAQRAGVARRQADDLILATLRALAERLTADETKDLLAQLPKKYKENVNAVPVPQPMTADEFVARAAQLLGDQAPAPDEARGQVQAVLTTLREAVNAGELHDVFEQLGDDFVPLFGIEGNGRSAATASSAADMGREQVRNLTSTIGAVAVVVTQSVSSVVHTARDRALDLAVLAVDQLEAVTEKLDDAAEALQERVHRSVEAQR
jgi:uncharacterized protein (DUF2267 family)